MKFPEGMTQAITAVANLINRTNRASSLSDPAADSLNIELFRRMDEFLEGDHFFLMIQPIVDFRNDRLFHGEVLSRLNHPERGVIYPDVFLPIVDSLGMYSKFDRSIFRKSCAWISRALEDGASIGCISINFSRATLSEENLARDLIGIADSCGVPHSMLAIEITEQVPESGIVHLLDNLNRLKTAGFRIVLDDFGSGVTSFNDLMHYPLDIVKIDRSLLLEAASEQGADAYRDLVAMAIDLGAEVVCEGIETAEQNSLAREAGCRYGQGFLFCRPMPMEQIFELMRSHSIREVNP